MTMIEKVNVDVAVIGGGLSGLIAAIASARQGVKTALVHNRPVLGGNASSEIKMHICGADTHMQKKNARETGILEEILLENKRRNKSNSFYLLDSILWEKTRFQDNLTLYLNTHMTEVELKGERIAAVLLNQLTSEKKIKLVAECFVDATGDGTLGHLAGAESLAGSESKAVFGEVLAPDESNPFMMGSSLQFTSIDTGEKVDFIKPEWANTYEEADLKYRGHSQIDNGYWWIELGGDDKLDTITDAEEIRDELLKVLFGVWDHIKNRGDHKAENHELDWVGFLAGKRESRRLVGDYVLTADDILENRHFDDTVAYGGWPMDMHAVGGITAKERPTTYHRFKHLYEIPYRSLYSKNVPNLFIAGRVISVSKLAFGSTRVMGTCAVVGEAIGLAASLAVKKKISPRDVGKHIEELQQLALKNDLYLPGVKNKDVKDKALSSTVMASSFQPGSEPANVVNGFARTVGDADNCWQTKLDGTQAEWLELELASPTAINEVHVRFDSNLSKEIMISLSKQKMAIQDKDVQQTLVRDYHLCFYNKGRLVHEKVKTNNYLRNNIIKFDEAIQCDKVRLIVTATNGSEMAKVFEVRLY